ncbi:ig-like domain-containing protein [Trichonephila clavipes]|nr:ig-like domain-containing protein [Trichonephila clavipes]
MNSCPACRELELWCHFIEETNVCEIDRARNPSVGVVWYFGEGVPAQVSSSLDRGSKLQAPMLLDCFLCLLTPTTGQDSYYFQPHPQDKDVRKGQSVTLECGVSNSKHVVFYWTLNGDPVSNTSRRYQEGSNLHFTRVDPAKDIGEFKCIATNVTTGISLASQGAQLNILYRASFIISSFSAFFHNPSSSCHFADAGARREEVDKKLIQHPTRRGLKWFGLIWRSPENNPTRAYTFKNPMGSRTRGRPPTRWIDDVENDLKTLSIKNWQRVAAYHWNWRKRAVEAAKTCNRLLRL